MAYDIILIESVTGRTVGDDIFLSNLPTKPKILVLFYAGSDDTNEVEKGLRRLGPKDRRQSLCEHCFPSRPSLRQGGEVLRHQKMACDCSYSRQPTGRYARG